jgi:hypothetical protein
MNTGSLNRIFKEQQMQTTIMHILLTVALASTAHAETKCYAIEHLDHDEAVCVGDVKSLVDKSVSAKSIPSAFEPQQSGQQAPEKGAAATVTATGSLNDKTVIDKSVQLSGGMGGDTAAHLARRKALAIKNSLQLNGKARQPEPGTEQVPK